MHYTRSSQRCIMRRNHELLQTFILKKRVTSMAQSNGLHSRNRWARSYVRVCWGVDMWTWICVCACVWMHAFTRTKYLCEYIIYVSLASLVCLCALSHVRFCARSCIRACAAVIALLHPFIFTLCFSWSEIAIMVTLVTAATFLKRMSLYGN